MEQEPSEFLQDALLPVMKALIGEALFKHCNEDVRVTVASCLSELLRITSPVQPYDDDQMKAIFELIVEALSKLSQPSTRCYEKALSILETIARVKACLLMLDLECEAQILDMCQHFWVFTRSNPSADEYWAVEQIMADILAESEDMSPDLLIRLRDSMLKENEKVAPSGWKLGEKLISDIAAKLRPNGSPKHGMADFLNSKGSILSRKRGPKPNSLMRPEEGYDLSWRYREGQTTKQPHKSRISLSRTDVSAMPMVSAIKRTTLKSNVETVRGEAALLPIDLRDKKTELRTRGGNNMSEGTSRVSGLPGRRLVGRRIKVWWPLDEKFYYGAIQSFDPFRKRHKVLYDDGDIERLNLEKERWELIKDDLPAEYLQEADHPKPDPSPIILEYKKGSGKKSESPRKLLIKQNVERAEASSFPKVEVPVGRDESSDDESTDINAYEIRFRSKDVQPEYPSSSTSDDSTPEASPPRCIRAKSKDVRLQSTSNDSTSEASPHRYIRAKSKDVRLQSTSDDSTPEGSPPSAWGLARSHFRRP